MQGLVRIAVVTAVFASGSLGAWAQSLTPAQIQGQIAAGQARTALGELQQAVQAHPTSGIAWYLTAEAQDAVGNESAASNALNKAEQYAPGLPFAKQGDVAQLQAHLNGAASAPGNYAPAAAAAPQPRGTSPFLLIGGVVVLFFLVRMFLRSRRRGVMPVQPGYGPTQPMGPGMPNPYNPGGMPYGGGMGGGSGIGGGLMSGLAAGAGFAAGERVLGNLMGGGGGGGIGGGNVEPGQVEEGPAPERDDGLNGNPGWDNSGGGDSGGGVDPNAGW